MKHGRERRQEAKNKKKRNLIIALIAILIVAVSIIFYILQVNKTDMTEPTDFEYEEQNTIEEPIVQDEQPENQGEPGIEIVDVSDMPSKANGFKVMGQIVIDKIGIKCYIYDTSSKAERLKALEVGTVRFAGPDLNEPRKSMYRGT